jgi:hypothetical protein
VERKDRPNRDIDGIGIDKAFDLQGLDGVEFDGLEVLLGEEDIVVLFDGIAFNQGGAVNRAGVGIGGHHPDAVAGGRVDEIERRCRR